MSIPVEPKPAKLVIGLILREKSLLEQVAAGLVAAYGDLEMVSAWFDFDFTGYYEKEMGRPLFRRMLVFRDLVGQDQLVRIKRETNLIEDEFADNGRRRVNIDPGLLSFERFVLATGKNYTHRIYLGEGIFADLTLVYQEGGFKPLAWTYPDYGQRRMRDFLEKVRTRYREQVRRRKSISSPGVKGQSKDD